MSLYGGILSGTSLDGVDALLLRLEGSDARQVTWEIVAFETDPYAPEERDRIREDIATGGARELALLHVDLGRRFAGAFHRLLETARVDASEVEAIGSHGQTVWHEPPTAARAGATLQLGDPAGLAEATGLDVVSDFRARDVAAGGHGAPLVPWCDWVLLRRPEVGRALQNLGGMGNVTFLPRDEDPAGVRGFDTGPGVALIDGAARRASGGVDLWDSEGRRAARGRVDPALLDALLSDPFFGESPPRSTGRERFGDARLEALVARAAPASEGDWDDLLATLTELTARSMADAYERFLPLDEVDEIVLTGGGARNPTLVERITRLLAPIPVRSGPDALGLDPDAREAAAFALLAWAHVNGIPSSLPAVTGARGSRVLGSWVPGKVAR